MEQAVDINRTGRPDRTLLAEFLATHDEGAFAELVRRHGGLVYGTCYRVLGHTQDAEDAAQAVFLTLARKARSLQGEAPLAGWLHTVAWRLALDVRKLAERRRRREQEVAQMADQVNGPDPTAERDEVRRWLDQELAALPAKYRLPLLLHHFEGKTKEETAQLLGENPGTVSTRLNRARQLLRQRLARRGVVLAEAALMTWIAQSVAAVEPSLEFIARTAKAASLTAAGQATAGLVSAQAAALTQGALHMLLLTSIKKGLVVMAAVGLLLAAGASVYFSILRAEPSKVDFLARQDSMTVSAPAAVELSAALLNDGVSCNYLGTGGMVDSNLFRRIEQYTVTVQITTPNLPLEKDSLFFTLYDENDQVLSEGPVRPSIALAAGQTGTFEINVRQNPTGRRLVIRK